MEAKNDITVSSHPYKEKRLDFNDHCVVCTYVLHWEIDRCMSSVHIFSCVHSNPTPVYDYRMRACPSVLLMQADIR